MKKFLEIVFKIVLLVISIPLLYASFYVFRLHLSAYPSRFEHLLVVGAVGFLAVYHFFYKFDIVFEGGHRIVASLLSFCKPFDRFVAHLFPFYFLLLFGLYGFIIKALGFVVYQNHFIFSAGVIMALHVVLAVQDIKDEEQTVLSLGYFLKASIICIVSVYLLVLFLDMAIGILTFPKFFSLSVEHAEDIYLNGFNFIMSLVNRS